MRAFLFCVTLLAPAGLEPVQVPDRSGTVSVAYYAMQRQKDGTWRTNGCHLVQPARTISA